MPGLVAWVAREAAEQEASLGFGTRPGPFMGAELLSSLTSRLSSPATARQILSSLTGGKASCFLIIIWSLPAGVVSGRPESVASSAENHPPIPPDPIFLLYFLHPLHLSLSLNGGFHWGLWVISTPLWVGLRSALPGSRARRESCAQGMVVGAPGSSSCCWPGWWRGRASGDCWTLQGNLGCAEALCCLASVRIYSWERGRDCLET